jgi:hypothetical protein
MLLQGTEENQERLRVNDVKAVMEQSTCWIQCRCFASGAAMLCTVPWPKRQRCRHPNCAWCHDRNFRVANTSAVLGAITETSEVQTPQLCVVPWPKLQRWRHPSCAGCHDRNFRDGDTSAVQSAITKTWEMQRPQLCSVPWPNLERRLHLS